MSNIVGWTLSFIGFQAKAEYERDERRRERKKATGEDKWILPSLNKRIAEPVSNDAQ